MISDARVYTVRLATYDLLRLNWKAMMRYQVPDATSHPSCSHNYINTTNVELQKNWGVGISSIAPHEKSSCSASRTTGNEAPSFTRSLPHSSPKNLTTRTLSTKQHLSDCPKWAIEHKSALVPASKLRAFPRQTFVVKRYDFDRVRTHAWQWWSFVICWERFW